jgi:hypothetical protein
MLRFRLILNICFRGRNLFDKSKSGAFIFTICGIFSFNSSAAKISLSDLKILQQITDTVVVYDTVFVHDTVYSDKKNQKSDTLKKIVNSTKIKPKIPVPIKEKSFFYPTEYELRIGTNYSKPIFSGSSAYDTEMALKRQAAGSLPGFSTGILFRNQNKNFSTSTGLMYSVFRESFNFEAVENSIRQIQYYKYFTRTELQTNTVWFMNLDSLLVGDTVWVPLTYTHEVSKADSVLSVKNDTSKVYHKENSINRYSYIEIPIILGFPFRVRKFLFYPEIGIISGIILNSKGKTIYLPGTGKNAEIRNEIKLSPLNISVFLGLRSEFDFTEKAALTAELYFRQNINSIYSDYPIIKRNRTMGISVGIRLKI